jgi:hypothetical protein
MASYTQRNELLGTNVFQLWWMGAQDVPKATVETIQKAGAVVKAGVKTVTKTTQAILDAAGETAKGAASTVKALPLILGILAVGITGYLIFAGKKGTDLTKFIPIPRK